MTAAMSSRLAAALGEHTAAYAQYDEAAARLRKEGD